MFRFSAVITLALLAGCGNTDNNTNTAAKPPTNIHALNYYPDCEFTIVDTIKVHSGIVNTDLSPADKRSFQYSEEFAHTVGSPAQTFHELQQRAKRNSADAVAVIDYFVDKGDIRLAKGKSVYGEKHTMQAELIKLYSCPANRINDPRGKLVKFNREGKRNLRDSSKVVANFDQLLMIDNAATNHVLSNVINVNQQVLGFDFTMTKKQLVSVLGAPSAMLQTNQDELVLFYGRNYLFMFKGKQFVGFEHARKLLPTHLSNRIPFNEQFDELTPKLNQTFALGSKAADVVSHLGIQAKVLKNRQASIHSKSLVTHLTFEKSHRYAKQLSDYELGGIAMYKKGVKPFNWRAIAANKPKLSFIDLERSFFGKGNAIDRNIVGEALGMPDMKIMKSAKKEVWVYGNELIFDFYRGFLNKYRFVSTTKNKSQPCVKCLYLGQAKRDLPSKYITRRTQNQYTLENNQFSYLVEFSNDEKVDDIEVFLKQ